MDLTAGAVAVAGTHDFHAQREWPTIQFFDPHKDPLCLRFQQDAISDTGEKASALTRSFDTVPQLLKNVRFAAGSDPLGNSAVVAAIADAETKLAGSGRLLIRKSGTEPLIRVMAECEDDHLLAQVVDQIVAEVSAAV